MQNIIKSNLVNALFDSVDIDFLHRHRLDRLFVVSIFDVIIICPNVCLFPVPRIVDTA